VTLYVIIKWTDAPEFISNDLIYNGPQILTANTSSMDSVKQILEYQIISFGDQPVTVGHVADVAQKSIETKRTISHRTGKPVIGELDSMRLLHN
jgi:hypothetical protein